MRTRLGTSPCWPISCRRRGSTGTACRLETSQGCSPRITSSGPPSRPMTKGNVGKRPDAAAGWHAVGGQVARGDAPGDCCDSCDKPPSHDTSRKSLGQTHGPGGGGVSAGVPGVWWRHPSQSRRPGGAGSFRTGGSQAEEGQDGFARVKSAPHAPRRTARASVSLAGPWSADRLGRARPGPLSTGQAFRRCPTTCPTSTSTASDGIPEERFQGRPARRGEKSGLERGQEAPRHLHDRAASSPTSSGGCSS